MHICSTQTGYVVSTLVLTIKAQFPPRSLQDYSFRKCQANLTIAVPETTQVPAPNKQKSMAPTIVVISEEESRSPRWSISSWFSERDSSVFSRAGKWQNARKAAKRCKLGGDAGLHSGMSWYMTTFCK